MLALCKILVADEVPSGLPALLAQLLRSVPIRKV